MRWSPLAFVGLLACTPNGAKPIAVASASAVPSTPSPAPPSALPPVPSSPPAISASDAGASDPRTDGAPTCRFERLAEWTERRISWLGACRGGFAHGSGVLLAEVDGVEPERFYGRLVDGRPSVGVLQSGTGSYTGEGKWAHGALVAPLEDGLAARNVIIDAFEVAGTAAKTVSDSFTKKGDATSARFYATQAKQLRNQMD